MPTKVIDDMGDSSSGSGFANPFDAPQGDTTTDTDAESVESFAAEAAPILAKGSFFAHLATSVRLTGEQGLRYAIEAMQQLPDLLMSFNGAVKSAAVLHQVDGQLPCSQIWLRMHFVQHVTEHILRDDPLLSILDADDNARLNVRRLVKQWNAHWDEVFASAEGLEYDPTVIRSLSESLKTHFAPMRRIASLIADAARNARPGRYRPMNFLEAVGPWPLACLTLLGIHIAALIQATLGFLVYNWPAAFGDIQWRLALAGFIITLAAVITMLLLLIVLQTRNVNPAKTWKWLKATLPAAEAATRRLVIESRGADMSSNHSPGEVWGGANASSNVLGVSTGTHDSYMDVQGIMRTAPVICVDRNLNITFFNAAAEELTGFTHGDAIGRSVGALVTEQSQATIAKSVKDVAEGMDTVVSPHFVTVVSVDHFMVQLQFTYTALRTSPREGSPITGVALIGRQVFDLEQTNDVFLVRYRHSELSAMLPHLRECIKAKDFEATDASLKRCFRVVDSSSWANITVAAHQMKQWRAVPTRSVLDTISRNYMSVTDLSFSKNLPDFVECDAEGICMIISELLQGLIKRCTITVDVRNFDSNFSSMRFTLRRLVYEEGVEPFDSPLLESLLVNIGASLAVDSKDQLGTQVTLLCPHLVVTDTDETSISFRNPAAGGSGKKKRDEAGTAKESSAAYSFNFLLFENNSIFRHTVSMGVWGMGHSVSTVEGPSGVERFVGANAQRVVHCALIDCHSPVAPLIVKEIRKRDENVHIVLLAERKPQGLDTELIGLPLMTKPVKRAALEDLASKLAEIEESRNRRQKELEEQRKVLSAHRSAPWHRGKKLGSGSFADVYVATSDLTGAQMAVKIIYLDRLQDTQDALVNEIGIMCKLSHPNIVHYFYCEEGDRCVNLFMELCAGSLQSRARDNGRAFNHEESVEITRQVLIAVEYLHSLELVHRDIKPGNVLIGRDGQFKLADFGTATKAKDELVATAGTFRFMAPEVFSGEQYGQACDIWSVGILYLDLVQKLPPPGFVAMPSLVDDLDASQVTLPGGLDQDTHNFLSLCLQMDQSQRPSAATLLHHPFFHNKTESAPGFTRAAGGAVATAGPTNEANVAQPDRSGSVNSDSDLLPGI